MNRIYYGRKKSRRSSKKLFFALVILVSAIFFPLFFAYLGAKDLQKSSKALASAYQNQNFGQIQKETTNIKNAFVKTNISLTPLLWLRFVPIIGGYYGDVKGLVSASVEDLTAAEKLLARLKEYEEQLGFSGTPLAGPERVSQAIKILEKSLSHLDEVKGHFRKAASSVQSIETDKYPKVLGGIELRRSAELAKNILLGIDVAANEGYPALQKAPSALGQPTVKTYLLLFQNDKEIRPTGGFITAFAHLNIEKGKISTTVSDDIYRLDERLLATCQSKICPLTPPEPIVKYLPEVTGKTRSAWSMRDSNISPDLPTAAKEFERMFQLLGQGLPFDGIIYIDSQVVEELIEVTGPIDVLGTTYSAAIDKRCNCPNVIYELESYAEIAAKGQEDRKAILGVLMQQILARALGSDTDKIPLLIETLARLANHKHIMFYMHDANLQDALSTLNWTGELKEYDGDYLHINDSNFAGGKSNLYVEQSVTQEIDVKGDKVKKKIAVEYKNSQPFGVWLNGINRDYVRFYAPSGSKLISSKGFEEGVNTIEDLGKTVFESFLTVRPQNSRKVEIEFTTPYNPKGEYKLLIQKQPGAKDFTYKIKINGSQKGDFKLDRDKEFKFDL
ncbi:MAG: DUF4012 domain-containing protein [Patescibacteria group bacterium]